MASGTILRLSVFLLLLVCPPLSAADALKITSSPVGASVEIDGVPAGATPFEKTIPAVIFTKRRRPWVRALNIPWSRASA
jgi:hypothetical protein